MDQRLQTAQKGCHVPGDAPTLSSEEETKETPVSSFNPLCGCNCYACSLDSADGFPREDEITKEISVMPITSANGGLDIQSYSPITQLPDYPSSDSADGIPREDEYVKNSTNAVLDIRSRSPVMHSHKYTRGGPNSVTTLMLGSAGNTTGKDHPLCWVLDSGATNHATGNRKLISQMTTDKARIQFKVANGGYLWSHGCGHVITEQYTLADVHYVPGLDMNIVSVSELNDMDYNLEFTRNGCIIKDARNNNLVGKGIRGVSGLVELDSLRIPLERT